MKRLSLHAEGGVQGVGFRPFVYRIAVEEGLRGWVRNTPSGASIEVQGEPEALARFRKRLRNELPPPAYFSSLDAGEVDTQVCDTFEILNSGSGRATAVMMPDLATCSRCLEEIFDPSNRRYLYPFTNCTACGPRFTIIRQLPYDRSATSMCSFTMCPECRAEYEDPMNRRFHAQPNACPVCGPDVFLRDAGGRILFSGGEALEETCRLVLQGSIAAVKGLGGFHLVSRADIDEPVVELRRRKQRPFKPLAVMVGSTNLLNAEPAAEKLLNSSAAPIVLLPREQTGSVCLSRHLAPGVSTVGIMVPYTPLHHILLRKIDRPLVATSGNRAGEPICTCFEQARENLSGIADFFLDNNRPILRPVDDSVMAVSRAGVTPVRRSRGYAPLPVTVGGMKPGILAMGGNERNTVSFSRKNQVIPSQYLGNMSRGEALANAVKVIEDMTEIYSLDSRELAIDMHPDYAVREIVTEEASAVQHHHAHMRSCMAENGVEPPALGMIWDGSGYGTDGTVWGGEILALRNGEAPERLFHFRTFPLPGGEQAVRYPSRTAAGMLFEAFPDETPVIPGLNSGEMLLLHSMMRRGVNCPGTSSVGRLFDGVSALLGLCAENTYSGEAAVRLQSVASREVMEYPVCVDNGTIDWAPVLEKIRRDISGGVSPECVSRSFHRWLACVALECAERAGIRDVVLSGGCFLNTLLLDDTSEKLEEAGYSVYTHHLVPPGDGGLSLGQAVIVMEEKDVSRNSR